MQGGTLLNSINEQVLKQLVIRHIISTISYRSYYFDNQGLLSYTDFHFLLLLMSTPTRYLDIIFHGFDISADGNVEAKVTTTIFGISVKTVNEAVRLFVAVGNGQRLTPKYPVRSLSTFWRGYLQ